MTNKGILATFFAVVVGFILLLVLWGSWYTIDEGERGVILRNGSFVGIAQPGLSFKRPLVDKVVPISVRTHTLTYPKLQAYSYDTQSADMAVSVTYTIAPEDVETIYKTYGSLESMENRIINRQVGTLLEQTFGTYTAVRAVQAREKLGTEYLGALRRDVPPPISIVSAQIENIDFNDAYEKSIEKRMDAEVQVKTREQNYETEKVQAKIQVTQAQARADSQLAEARAQAEGIRVKGEAEAAAIKVKSDALSANPALVELTKAERWNGALPTTMLPNSALPFIDARK